MKFYNEADLLKEAAENGQGTVKDLAKYYHIYSQRSGEETMSKWTTSVLLDIEDSLFKDALFNPDADRDVEIENRVHVSIDRILRKRFRVFPFGQKK